jgi:hypothetical protein
MGSGEDREVSNIIDVNLFYFLGLLIAAALLFVGYGFVRGDIPFSMTIICASAPGAIISLPFWISSVRAAIQVPQMITLSYLMSLAIIGLLPLFAILLINCWALIFDRSAGLYWRIVQVFIVVASYVAAFAIMIAAGGLS